jgi:hypothetical protein
MVKVRGKWLALISGLFAGTLLAVLPTLSDAQFVNHPQHPVHPGVTHPVHPTRAPRPTRTPRGGGGAETPVVPPTPTPHFQSCPAPPDHELSARLTKLFYAYPSPQRVLRASGFFNVDYYSNGIHPTTEPASLTLTDDDGAVILSMPNIQFSDTGGGSFSASNDQGYVSIRPFAGMSAFDFTFDNPNFPPNFFRVRLHLCFNIGDDGFGAISIVCQHKTRGGFVCHQ